MIQVELNRVHGEYGFAVTDMYGHTVNIDNSPDHGGENFGVRPMQTLLMGLAGCSGMDVISILKKQRQVVKDYKTIVRGEREAGVVVCVVAQESDALRTEDVSGQSVPVGELIALSEV